MIKEAILFEPRRFRDIFELFEICRKLDQYKAYKHIYYRKDEYGPVIVIYVEYADIEHQVTVEERLLNIDRGLHWTNTVKYFKYYDDDIDKLLTKNKI